MRLSLKQLRTLSPFGLGLSILVMVAGSGLQKPGAVEAVPIALARHWTGAVEILGVALSFCGLEECGAPFDFPTQASCNAAWCLNILLMWALYVGAVYVGAAEQRHKDWLAMPGASSYGRGCSEQPPSGSGARAGGHAGVYSELCAGRGARARAAGAGDHANAAARCAPALFHIHPSTRVSEPAVSVSRHERLSAFR